MPTLTINGRQVEVPQGASVLDAVLRTEADLPHLCKDADMGAIGACRTCLVQVEGQRGFPASCSLPAAEGMAVLTETPDVRRIRQGVLELTVGMLPAAADADVASSLAFPAAAACTRADGFDVDTSKRPGGLCPSP